jgi:glycosyltransferase involved in cell wall biosynthesis
MPSDRHRILYFSSFGNLRWGGQRSLYHLATRLDRSAFRAHVVVPSEDGLADALRKTGIGVTVLDLPTVALRNAREAGRALGAVHELIGRLDADIVHTDGPRNTLYAGLAARLRGKPLVWHIRTSEYDRYDRLLYGLSSRVVLVARALRARFGWARGQGKFETIYNGVDLSQFSPSDGKLARKHYGIDGETLVISTTARIEPSKGQIHLIEACALARKNLPDFRILLAGGTSDRDYRDRCAARAAAFGISDRLIFAGEVDDVMPILQATDIFVLPSLAEAFPRSVIEAMAVGRPVVVSDAGGCPESVVEGESGLVFPAGDVGCLSERLLSMAGDRSRRERMGEMARRRVRELFDIEENVRKTEALYREMLDERRDRQTMRPRQDNRVHPSPLPGSARHTPGRPWGKGRDGRSNG